MRAARVGFGSLLLTALLGFSVPARAGEATAVTGPNSDFPDAYLVMPFDAASPRATFLTVSNVGSGPIDAAWYFYDRTGELVARVTRVILGEGGTDIVDLTQVADRGLDSGGELAEGPTQSLAGRRGFAVVVGDGDMRLIGSYTIANTSSNAAYGAVAAGFGVIGALAPGAALLGTTFDPRNLQDNELIIVALNPSGAGSVTSLTNGASPAPGAAETLRLTVTLHGNSGDGIVAQGTFPVTGTALFTSLEELFPGGGLAGSATIDVVAAEGPGYSGSELDPDGDADVPVIGFYGQALGPFGTGQSLRTLQ